MNTLGVLPVKYGVAVTTSDSTENIRNAVYLQNTGTAGAFTVRQSVSGGHMSAPSGATTVTCYLKQGDFMRVPASWLGVNTTGLGGGVTLIAFY